MSINNDMYDFIKDILTPITVEIEDDERKDELLKAIQVYGSLSELERRFGLDSFGRHEAFHASHMVLEMFAEYVANSPAVILNRELYHQAQGILDKLYNMYCSLEPGNQNFGCEK